MIENQELYNLSQQATIRDSLYTEQEAGMMPEKNGLNLEFDWQELKSKTADFAREAYDGYMSTDDREAFPRHYRGGGILHRVPYLIRTVEHRNPSTLVATKMFYVKPHHERQTTAVQLALIGAHIQEQFWRVAFAHCFPEETDLRIADMRLCQHPDGFVLGYRFVGKRFRRQGFGELMLKIISKFVQEFARHEKRVKKIIVPCSQLGVIRWLLHANFLPETEEDEVKLEKIKEGSDFNVDHLDNIFPKKMSENERYFSGEGINRGAYQVTLVKTIEPPSSHEIESVSKEVSTNVLGIC